MTQKKSLTRRKKIILSALIMGFLVLTFVSVFYYHQYQLILKNPRFALQQEADSLAELINKSVELPQDEEPYIVTISDQTIVEDNNFLEKAEKGDKLLIYAKAGLAVLYRPSINKVIIASLIDPI